VLSIVIPTLNAANVLGPTLEALAAAGQLPHEVIVADGGSIDDTPLIAINGGAILLEAQRGRGRQLAAGAAAAAGDWLLFLHADTQPQAGWVKPVQAFMADPENRFRAGYFRFALDDRARAARMIERVVGLRSRLLGLPYGDQGLLIGRIFYEKLGGYKRLPLMEDVDIVHRIGRNRLRPIAATAVTSADKYRRDGYLLRPIRNLVMLGLYTAGVSPRYLNTLYH
jgi:rSAM/selenodomain-associated transferase 2